MVLRNPAALLGLWGLLVPLVLHLLSQHRAKRVDFPTLRFVPETRPVPEWSSKPSDYLLLVLRMIAIAAAVIALSGPFMPASGTEGNKDDLARAVVVDTSLHSNSSSAARDSMIAAASRLSDSAAVSRIIYSNDPAAAMSMAAQWLQLQPAAVREVVVVSDMRYNKGVNALSAALIPEDMGIKLVRVNEPNHVEPSLPVLRTSPSSAFTVERFAKGDSTTISYKKVAAYSSSSVSELPPVPKLLGGTSAQLEQLRSLLSRLPYYDSYESNGFEPVSVYYAGDSTWQSNRAGKRYPFGSNTKAALIVLALQRDSRVASASALAVPIHKSNASVDSLLLPISTNRDGNTIVDAATTDSGVEIFVNAEPLSAVSVAILESLREQNTGSAYSHDYGSLSDAELASIQREGSHVASRSSNGKLLSRWFWLVVATALLVEQYVRRVKVRSKMPSKSRSKVLS